MSLLRKRNSGSENLASSFSNGNDFFNSLKNFDAYAKPLDDFRIKTSSGAAGMLNLFVFPFSLEID